MAGDRVQDGAIPGSVFPAAVGAARDSALPALAFRNDVRELGVRVERKTPLGWLAVVILLLDGLDHVSG